MHPTVDRFMPERALCLIFTYTFKGVTSMIQAVPSLMAPHLSEMVFASVLLLLLANTVGASPHPQGVTEAIPPSAPPPAGCSPVYEGTFGLVAIRLSMESNSNSSLLAAAYQIDDGQVQVRYSSERSILAPPQTLKLALSPWINITSSEKPSSLGTSFFASNTIPGIGIPTAVTEPPIRSKDTSCRRLWGTAGIPVTRNPNHSYGKASTRIFSPADKTSTTVASVTPSTLSYLDKPNACLDSTHSYLSITQVCLNGTHASSHCSANPIRVATSSHKPGLSFWEYHWKASPDLTRPILAYISTGISSSATSSGHGFFEYHWSAKYRQAQSMVLPSIPSDTSTSMPVDRNWKRYWERRNRALEQATALTTAIDYTDTSPPSRSYTAYVSWYHRATATTLAVATMPHGHSFHRRRDFSAHRSYTQNPVDRVTSIATVKANSAYIPYKAYVNDLWNKLDSRLHAKASTSALAVHDSPYHGSFAFIDALRKSRSNGRSIGHQTDHRHAARKVRLQPTASSTTWPLPLAHLRHEPHTTITPFLPTMPSLPICSQPSTLALTLSNGILTDSKGRRGYIAGNHQFQFDAPPQHGAVYTAGFSVCRNGSLALGGLAEWWQCRVGDIWNLYDAWIAPQCEAVVLKVGDVRGC